MSILAARFGKYLHQDQKSTLLKLGREIVYQVKRPYRYARRVSVDLRIGKPQGRGWRSGIHPRLMISIMQGYLRYQYNGRTMIKHPIDIALYLMLIQEIKPKTIIEIGTKHGGTAEWLHDNSEAVVHTIDNTPLHIGYRNGVYCHKGDEVNLQAVDLDWDALPHPWLIIDDASHEPQFMLPALRFLEGFCERGDYMIIEDGFVSELGEDRRWSGGPAEAIYLFLKGNPRWQIDSKYCDWFGYNVTGNPNGYLRRIQ